MKRRTPRLLAGVAVALLAAGVVASSAATPSPAGASTDQTTLSGEGGTFLEPVVTKLVIDSSSNLGGLFGAYVATGLETGIKDFIGTAPKAFNADFAVSERPLTAGEAATAKANGRSFAYVPIAATPVAVATLVPTTAYQGGQSIDISQLCPHVNLSVTDLGAIFGIDSAQPVNSWNDTRLKCSNGQPLGGQGKELAANFDPTMANYALMSLLDSDPVAKGFFAAGLQSAFALHSGTTTDTTPSEKWPYTGSHVTPGGDQPFVGKLLTINATTNTPSHQAGEWALGAVFPISSVWTGAPLGAPWNIPTAAVQNAQGTDVAPSVASATAAEEDASVAVTSDPATDNLVTFNARPNDAAAYNNYLMEETYLVVPTNGLAADKATAMAGLIRFALGPAGQRDIESFGAAPATSAMVASGLKVANELTAEAAPSAATTTTTTTSSTTTSTTAGATGSGISSDAGSSTSAGGSGSTSGSTSPNLAFTGSPDLAAVVGVGAVLVVGGAFGRRRLRRRVAKG